ncbi:MAG: glycosyl hydrolase family 65 protein [Candidatus Gastranaerophilales bacterium]|nr:glycosyl hydrolase family 65 protein [Candidatus Gastranaerophilales bacterium]
MEMINLGGEKQKIDICDLLYIIEDGFEPVREREVETLLSIGNGYVGTRNSLSEYYKLSTPATFVAGIYEKSSDYNYNELVKLPNWTRIEILVEDNIVNLFEAKIISHRRYLDFKNGITVREWISQDNNGRITNIKFVKYISLSNKHEAGKTLIITPDNYTGKIKVRSGIDAAMTSPIYTISQIAYTIPEYVKATEFITLAIKPNETNYQVAMSQRSEFWLDENIIPLTPFCNCETEGISYSHKYEEDVIYEEWEWVAEMNRTYIINGLVSIYTSIDGDSPVDLAKLHLSKFEGDIYSKSLEPHIKMWMNRWNESHIIVYDDAIAQRWINFALYHLITAGEFSGKFSSIPARTLTGEAYKGHIFWDTEMYLVPFYTFTKPEIAKSLLLYRYNTLPGALANARKEGYRGACYAWESTDSGIEMTPSHAMLPDGQLIKIYSGKYENHISPDIAYAAWQYWIVTHDEEFLLNHGAEMIFEIARFCRSLMVEGSDGYYHINNVIGPDEYHELVDDNTYMNLMTQFNLETALKIVKILKINYKNQYEIICQKIKLTEDEIEDWAKTNDRIYVSIDPIAKVYEQFKGYFELKFVNLAEYEPRTAPMDLILGRDKIANTQIIKQADVVMFLFLLATKFSREVIETNFDYYEMRTGHGSSLSPGIYSIVAARLGKTEMAYKYFKQNATIDLDNKMGNVSGGIHIASMGATWMTITMGFGGMYIHEKGLMFDPHLPDQWDSLKFTVNWRNHIIHVQITKTEISFNISGIENIFISAGIDNWKNLSPNIPYTVHFEQKWHWK